MTYLKWLILYFSIGFDSRLMQRKDTPGVLLIPRRDLFFLFSVKIKKNRNPSTLLVPTPKYYK